jgi:MFS transporter, LPLT family, lysophospholipid transporter
MPRTGAPLQATCRATRGHAARLLATAAALWRDKLGQISLAVTTLFWGAGATLQFIVLEVGGRQLGYNLSRAAILQGVVALGIAVGAVIASMRVPLDRLGARHPARHRDGRA